MTNIAVPRMRTIKEAMQELKELDPLTAMREYHIRDLVNNNKIPHVRAGRKILVNFDGLLKYLEQSEPSEPQETPQANYGTVRKVSLNMPPIRVREL